MFQWQVNPEEKGMAALAWLRHRLPRAPVGYLRRLLMQGRVKSRDGALDPLAILKEGDVLFLPDSQRLKQFITERRLELSILLETSYFLAVDKPSGLPVHCGADPDEDNLTSRVQSLLRKRKERFSAAPVHRLDLATSGPVLFGKGRQATGRLGRLIMENQIEKHYLALVAGRTPECGRWTDPVRAKGKLREAETTFRTLERIGNHSLIEARPRTGRNHQIRQHSAAAGHPLVEDRRYGGPAVPGLRYMFLHCSEIIFPDPWSGKSCRIFSPLPQDLLLVLGHLGFGFTDENILPGEDAQPDIRGVAEEP